MNSAKFLDESYLGFEKQQYQDFTVDSEEFIFRCFLDNVKIQSPDWLLQAFEDLFILLNDLENSVIHQALNKIVVFNQEQTFNNILRRSCYILVNNWKFSRNYQYIQKLLDLFSRSLLEESISSPVHQRLRKWLINFTNSEDYQQIRNFLSQQENPKNSNSSNNEIIAAQNLDFEKYRKQQALEQIKAKQNQKQFKFDLAMYTARPYDSTNHSQIKSNNPTILGNKVVKIIQKILIKKGLFNNRNIANIFLKQTQGYLYKDFKQSLLIYLMFSFRKDYLMKGLEVKINSFLDSLYQDYHEEICDSDLLLRTCNRLVELLTTQNRKEPSSLFTFLSTQDRYIVLALLLLKLILISGYSYTHLECCLNNLSRYYQDNSDIDNKWLLKLLDILKVTLTVHANNVDYDLVTMEISQNNKLKRDDLNKYRIFSQARFKPQYV